MRTRRSPRNQERLFRELFQAPEQPKQTEQVPLTDTEIEAMWWLPKISRSLMKRDAAKARQRKG